jgi:hypothetical protein
MHDPERTIPILEELLRSISALKKLWLTWEFIPNCLPMILHHQGYTLRQLYLRYVGSFDPWNRNQCIDVLTKTRQLGH